MKSWALFFLIISSMNAAMLELEKVIPNVVISEEHGGYVSGGAFSTADLRGKVHVLMYVDPDESDSGENLNQALRVAKDAFREGTFKTVAVINMAATWLPNFAIRAKLKSKQEKYPKAAFVKDEASILVKNLGMLDNGYEAMILDENGVVLRLSEAPFSAEEVEQFVSIVQREVAKLH